MKPKIQIFTFNKMHFYTIAILAEEKCIIAIISTHPINNCNYVNPPMQLLSLAIKNAF